jgi:hypothetical protein
MSTNTPVANRWSKRFPVALIILAVGLILSYLLIVPAPAFTPSAHVIGNENSVVSNEAAPVQRGWDAYTARYIAMAERFTTNSNSAPRGLDAYAARYTAMAEAYTAKEAAQVQRGWDAYAVRYAAMAKQFAASSNNTQRGLDAYAARYTTMAKTHVAKEAAQIQRGWDACAARYAAMAETYAKTGLTK